MPKKTQQDSEFPEPTVRDESICIGDNRLDFPNHCIVRKLGQGKNGAVFLAENETLRRTEAIKIWTKLRSNDRRDKLKQGLEEARKAASVVGYYVAQVYSAGVTNGNYFYAVMEYVRGETLEQILEVGLSPLNRYRIAVAYIDAIEKTAEVGTLHGDAHTNNVLVDIQKPDRPAGPEPDGSDDWFFRYMATFKPGYTLKLVDFGTSYFAKNETHEHRHWRVVDETMRRLLVNAKNQERIDAYIAGAMPVLKACDKRVLEFYLWLFAKLN
jgi:serine/threonine protein kinase